MIQIDSLSSILDSLSGLNFFYESFIVRKLKTRSRLILNNILGQKLWRAPI